MSTWNRYNAYTTTVWTLVFLLFSVTMSAQTVTEGRVADDTEKGIPYANIAVLSADSSYINGVTTDGNGHFSLSLIKGNLLRVSCVGYKTSIFEYAGQNPLIITLMADSHELQEVTVKSHAPKTQFKGEGMITTVEGSILERMPTMDLMLDRIPGLMSRQGSVSVLGRGSPRIYINGRIMQDGAELERLRPEEIKTVEVIANPGARYPASVSCVVRIVTKKPVGEGLSGSTFTGVSVNEDMRTSGSENLYLNYRKRGLDISGTFAGSYTHNPDNKQVTETSFLEDTWQNTTNVTQEYNYVQAYARLGANYFFSPEQSIGTSVTYSRTPRIRAISDNIVSLLCNDELSETGSSNLASFSRSKSVSSNTYYMGKIGKMTIDFNADYYWGDSDNKTTTNEQYSENLQDLSTQVVKTARDTKNRLFATRLALSHPLFVGNVTFGGEYSHSKRNSFYNILPKDLLDDEESRIRESMVSAFLSYTFNIKKLYVQAGLRYERVDFKYYDHGQYVGAQSKAYGNWFPSLALSMPVGKTQMQLTYASDISRPSYNSLREGMQYDSRYCYETGNPFLVPTIVKNVRYAVSWKWLYAYVGYSHVSDQLSTLTKNYEGNPKIALMRPENLPSFEKAFAGFSLSPSFGCWYPSFQFMFSKQWMKTAVPKGESVDNPCGTFALNNTFETRWINFSLMLSANTGGSNGFGYSRKSFSADVVLYKRFLNNRLLIQLYANDILGTATSYNKYYAGALNMSVFEAPITHSVTLNVRYHFNATQDRYRGKGAGQSQKDRM